MRNKFENVAMLRPEKVKFIIVHCTATPDGRNVTVDDVDAWHRRRGFAGIGYHYLVYRDGTITPGRPESRIGAHCLGYNADSIGVCYVGGLTADGKRPADTRTRAQRVALRKLIKELTERYPGATVCGHNDFAAKACPCFDVRREFGAVALGVTALSAASCSSSRNIAENTNEIVETVNTTLRREDLMQIINDSVSVEIDNPRIQVVMPDSTSATVEASAIRVRKINREEKCALLAESEDCMTYGEAVFGRTVTEDVRPATPFLSGGMLVVGIGLAVLGCLIYKYVRHGKC